MQFAEAFQVEISLKYFDRNKVDDSVSGVGRSLISLEPFVLAAKLFATIA